MSRTSMMRKIKAVAAAGAVLAGITMSSPCRLTAIRDSMVKGGMSAAEGATKNLLDSLIVNFNEIFVPIPEKAAGK